MINYNSQEVRRIYFMCGILRDSLEICKEELNYLRASCNWPNMDFIRAAIYSSHGPSLERELPHLEGCLNTWETRKRKLEEK